MSFVTNYFNKNGENTELIFIGSIVTFSVLVRLLPFAFISFTLLNIFIAIILLNFYNHLKETITSKHSGEVIENFSWGFTKIKVEKMSLPILYSFLKSADIHFYKTFLLSYRNGIILFVFMFGDFIVAFKNLSLTDSGVYFALSLFCKFVFLSFLYFEMSFAKINATDPDRLEKILEIFYKNLNGLLSLSFVVFILFFILSRFLVEIFFGQEYMYFQTSLPFVMLANLSLLIALMVYKTAKALDREGTVNVLKVYVPVFTILFTFMSHNYIDTVTYFVIGGCSILSIFLYNFVIKRPY